MNIRPKTLRRLLILFTSSSLLVGILICVIIASFYRNARAMKRIRTEAMAAYGAGDYVKSVELLQTYRNMANAEDPETEFAYGVSRVHVELPNGKHFMEGIHVFEHYLQSLKPGDAAAERQLLELYVARGYFAGAVHLADEMLAVNPRDGRALHEKVLGLVGQHQQQAALEVSRKLNEIEPLNLREQIVTVMLLVRTNAPAERVVAHAQALRKAHPADPRFEMLLAFAYSQERQDAAAKELLLTAARRTPTDAQFVWDLALQLDDARMFVESDAFLRRSADAIADLAVQRMLAERLWEDGKFAELGERLKSQTPTSPKSDGALMAYRALALYADARTADAEALVAALAHRADPQSAAWAIGLQARYARKPLSAPALASRLADAVARDSNNPVLHLMLAEAYLRMSECELTIQQGSLASQRAKTWAAPFLMTAEALTATGRHAEAVESAREALDRAPDRFETRLMQAKTLFAWTMESGKGSDYTNLLKTLQEMQRTYHDAETLPLYVTVLARTGHREEAVKAVQAAIKSNPPLPTETLARLAEACDGEKLELGPQVREVARSTQGLSPEISLSQARVMLHAGQGDQGLQFLLTAAKGRENEISWRLAIALYREALGQGDALKDWIALGDQYPADLQLQQAILRAQSRVSDRGFWARTIDRVKAITGEPGILWRMERSRWLLTGSLSEREKAEAVNLLTQVVAASGRAPEPHRLLALAMEKVNNIPGAIAELKTVADAYPGDFAIVRELYRLLTTNHRNSDAVAYLDAMAQSRVLAVDARHWLARVYVEQGYNEKAIAVLNAETTAANGGAYDPGADGNIAEQQRILGGIYGKTRAWAQAEAAARSWRQHAPAQAMNADIALAEIYLLRPEKDPAAAIGALRNYVKPPAATINPRLLELYGRALVLDNRAAEAATLIAPLLLNSSKWRANWLNLAALQKDRSSASAWIEQASAMIPKDAPVEQCALAKAWYEVGCKFEWSSALATAAAILQPLSSAPDDIPQAWVLMAMTAQAQLDYDTAEKAYRRVLKKDPDSADCLNDLAYLLWLRGREADLPEARRLAESAIALRSNDASFYDTLARIQAKSGDVKLATQNFRMALEKDPNSVEAMIGQADLLSRDPATRDEAKSLVARIQRLMDGNPQLSSELKRQYQAARQLLASSL